MRGYVTPQSSGAMQMDVRPTMRGVDFQHRHASVPMRTLCLLGDSSAGKILGRHLVDGLAQNRPRICILLRSGQEHRRGTAVIGSSGSVPEGVATVKDFFTIETPFDFAQGRLRHGENILIVRGQRISGLFSEEFAFLRVSVSPW